MVLVLLHISVKREDRSGNYDDGISEDDEQINAAVSHITAYGEAGGFNGVVEREDIADGFDSAADCLYVHPDPAEYRRGGDDDRAEPGSCLITELTAEEEPESDEEDH